MRTLIIDDEAPARAALRGLLSQHPEVELVGEADSFDSAQACLARPDYELVFLDVHLRGCTGFDLLPLVRPEAQVIFVTGSDQHAVRAFEVNALDYVMKPIRPERLAKALNRLADSAPPLPSEKPANAMSTDDFVYVKTGSGTSRFLPLTDLVAVTSNQNYADVHLVSGERLMVRRTMKQWEDSLPSTHFVRVHRTAIVNLSHYRGADRQSYELTLLQLEGLEEPVKASHRFLPELREKLAEQGRQL